MKSSNVMLESPSVAFSSLLLPSSQALNLTVSFHKCSGRLFLSHPQGLVFGPDPCRGLTVLHPQVHPSLSPVDILKQTRSSHCPEETSPCPSLYDGLYTRQVVTSVTAPHSPHTPWLHSSLSRTIAPVRRPVHPDPTQTPPPT